MDDQEMVEQIARVCHAANAEYCRSIGDMSQPSWEEAPDWQKESARAGVSFHLDNPEAGPSGSHKSWLKQKEADGWQYGDVKDPEKKLHPCYLPFYELPPEQQMKDYIFTAIVYAFHHGPRKVAE